MRERGQIFFGILGGIASRELGKPELGRGFVGDPLNLLGIEAPLATGHLLKIPAIGGCVAADRVVRTPKDP